MSKIVLLDGPSGAGKSRLRRELLQAVPTLVFCKRLCTRAPRGDESDQDYDFVSTERFLQEEASGRLAAYRHFQFGMSYGLPREPVEKAVLAGLTVFALIDLGTIDQARRCWSNAEGVLLFSPLTELESRLRARGGHSQAQIEERLANAEAVWQRRGEYDHVLFNRQGCWEQTLQGMLAICSD